MSRIVIRTRTGVYQGELDRSDLSDELWLSLPFRADINMLGSLLYFEMPSAVKVVGDRKLFDKGDIAYWPEASALSIFAGPTPLSTDDGRPVAPYPMKKIGHVSNCDGMDNAGDRTRITIERA